MRYRRVQVIPWARGPSCVSCLCLPHRITPIQTYASQPLNGSPTYPPTESSPPEKKGRSEMKDHVWAAVQRAGEVGRQWGQKSTQVATAMMDHWWGKYEEFVGLNEVQEAQKNVTEAEAAFMVSRGMVREAHSSLELLQGKLKEVRDRLDRVSREEAQYLELATLEHRLLQEERRLRTTYERAEVSEREKFALFSAAVRESHEKERTRAERTKNWSIIGSVLGALIGVMGSTYINRVRLQELKNLLLEAQKGPESLQEALRVQAGNHQSQQEELRTLIDSFRVTLNNTVKWTSVSSTLNHEEGSTSASALKDQRTKSLLEALPSKLGQLEQGMGRLESELTSVKSLMEIWPQPRPEGADRGEQWQSEVVLRNLEETKRVLGEQMRTNTFYKAAITYTAIAVTVSAGYLLFRGAS
ncbi:mitochondrial potassium channel [Pholidichthys leucotaenia]